MILPDILTRYRVKYVKKMIICVARESWIHKNPSSFEDGAEADTRIADDEPSRNEKGTEAASLSAGS